MKKTAGRSVTEVRIIEAAVQLFSRQGYKGTSTREIAHLAEVNEATLFRCFVRKADLFWAAAESRLNRLKLGRELQHGLATDLDPAIVVPMLVTFVVDNMSQHPELMRLLYVAGFELPGRGPHVSRTSGPDLRRGECLLRQVRCARRNLRSRTHDCHARTGGCSERPPKPAPPLYRARLTVGRSRCSSRLCPVLAECSAPAGCRFGEVVNSSD